MILQREFNRVALFLTTFGILISSPGYALTHVDYQAAFGPREGCFLISDISNGKIVEEYNSKRCGERLAPCSSFKIAAALMAFERGILKDENQIVKWDGIKRDRDELNQDQTPYSWIKNSAMWVSQWITPQLGLKEIQHFLDIFSYGNEDFSGGITSAWQTSTLKISASEQVRFITNFWKEKLRISKRTVDLTKKIIFIKKLGRRTELYGKTGTGCIDAGCNGKSGGRMLGWFVGVITEGNDRYAFAANASDVSADSKGRPAGPRLRETVIELLGKLKLVK